MSRIFNFCIKAISCISLVLYPYKLSTLITLCCDMVASLRFCYLSSNHGRIRLRRPFNIIGHKYINLNNVYAGPGLRLECIDNYRGQKYNPSIVFGKNVCINYRCHIGVINRIVIGDNVLIGSNVLITDHSHGYNDDREINIPPADRILYSKGPVIIEDNVWIGANATILQGVKIGKNSIVGACSLVNKDVPENVVVAGIPAKIIKYIK